MTIKHLLIIVSLGVLSGRASAHIAGVLHGAIQPRLVAQARDADAVLPSGMALDCDKISERQGRIA